MDFCEACGKQPACQVQVESHPGLFVWAYLCWQCANEFAVTTVCDRTGEIPIKLIKCGAADAPDSD